MTRIEKTQALLEGWKVDLLLIDDPIDLYYLTGQELSLGRLVIGPEGGVLYVDGRYFEKCIETLPFPVVLNRGYGSESPFVKGWTHRGKRVGFDRECTPYATYETFTHLNCDMVPLSSPIKTLRAIKEPEEIAKLEKAASLGSEGYDFLLTLLDEGVTEEELAIELELFWRRRGGERLAFAPHIAFGANTSQPHYHPGPVPLEKGSPVLIDIGVVCERYHSDMTRVVSFGEPPGEIEQIYTIVYEAQQKALAACRPGVLAHEIDRAAREWITAKGYREAFCHSTGHGVGLEIHEEPLLRKGSKIPLRAGMVLTIEPGIYLPGVGGIRLEDTILITEGGYENLTKRAIASSLPII